MWGECALRVLRGRGEEEGEGGQQVEKMEKEKVDQTEKKGAKKLSNVYLVK